MRDGLTFVVPTYRLRDVAQTVAEYDEHFYKHGQPIEIAVFSTFLKRRMLETLTRITPTGIDMDYDGHVAAEEAEAILDKLSSLYGRVLAASDVTRDERRRGELLRFANDLNVHARSFERDPFEHDLAKIADATVRTIRGTMRVWPTLVEICERAKRAQALPARRLKSRMHRSERAMSLC